MEYRVVYDIRDEAGLYFLDKGLLLALLWLIAFCVIVYALDTRRLKTDELPPERVGRQMMRLGLIGCVCSGLLLAAWVVGYYQGGPIDAPYRAAWLLPSLLLVVVGWFTQKYPPTTPPPCPTRQQRVVMILVVLLIAGGFSVGAWIGYWNLRGSQAALDAGEGSIVEGQITRVTSGIKHSPRIVVGGAEFLFAGRPCGHLGREIWLEPGMRARVTHLHGQILRFEVAADAKPGAGAALLSGRRHPSAGCCCYVLAAMLPSIPRNGKEA